jgi:hypothetical protein
MNSIASFSDNLIPIKYFDPIESKILIEIIDKSPSGGIMVNELNNFLNLNNLSSENQRQRRHIILKELNLKLYLITGLREVITRKSSISDKRIKYYIIENEFDKILLIVKSLNHL